MIIIHGLKNCDSCRAAMKQLKAAGVEAQLNDLSQSGVSRDVVESWLNALGAAALINRKSATWRGLGEEARALADGDPATLLVENPKLIKRPVVESPDGHLSIGLDETRIKR